jgi:hypothetical protein
MVPPHLVLAVRLATLSASSVGRAREVIAAIDAAGATGRERVELAAIAAHESHLRRAVERCDVAGMGGAAGLWQAERHDPEARRRVCAAGAAGQARIALAQLRACERDRRGWAECYAGRAVPDRATAEIRALAGRLAA